jgi:hypothetical protein
VGQRNHGRKRQASAHDDGAISPMQTGGARGQCTAPRLLSLNRPIARLSCAAAGVSFEWVLLDVMKEPLDGPGPEAIRG